MEHQNPEITRALRAVGFELLVDADGAFYCRTVGDRGEVEYLTGPRGVLPTSFADEVWLGQPGSRAVPVGTLRTFLDRDAHVVEQG
jgi:hypothetical protein